MAWISQNIVLSNFSMYTITQMICDTWHNSLLTCVKPKKQIGRLLKCEKCVCAVHSIAKSNNYLNKCYITYILFYLNIVSLIHYVKQLINEQLISFFNLSWELRITQLKWFTPRNVFFFLPTTSWRSLPSFKIVDYTHISKKAYITHIITFKLSLVK